MCFRLKTKTTTSPEPLPMLAQGSLCFMKSTWEPGHDWAVLAGLCLQRGMALLCRLSRDRGELGPLFTLTEVQMGLSTCLHSPLCPFKKRTSFGMTLDKKMSCLFVKQSTCLKGDLWGQTHYNRWGIWFHDSYICIYTLDLALKA